MDTLTAITITAPTIVIITGTEDEDPFWTWTPERIDALCES